MPAGQGAGSGRSAGAWTERAVPMSPGMRTGRAGSTRRETHTDRAVPTGRSAGAGTDGAAGAAAGPGPGRAGRNRPGGGGRSGIFAGALAAYATGRVRIGAKATRWAVGTTLGLVVLFLADPVAAWCGVDVALWGGGVWSFVISGVAVAAASFFLLVDFEAADRCLRSGASYRWAGMWRSPW